MDDPRVDAYMDKAETFAQPILKHVRQLVHQTCPEVEEDIKWGMPFFTLGGKNLANMAAFKQHVAFGYWEGLGIETPKSDEAMGHYGKITSINDLPPDKELITAIQSAAQILQEGQKKPKPKPKPVKVPPMPDYFAQAIATNPAAAKDLLCFFTKRTARLY